MATVSATINAPSENGLLSVVLREDDSANQDCEIIAYVTLPDGSECEVGRCTALAPTKYNGKGNRVVAVVNVPGASSYRVTATKPGTSHELSLVHGNASNALQLGDFTPVEYRSILTPGTAAESSISSLSGNGALSVFALQSGSPSRPVYTRVYSRDASGNRYLCCQVETAAAALAPSSGNRATALVCAPGALSYDVELYSADPVAAALKYGALDNVAIVGAIAVAPGSSGVAGNQPRFLWVDPVTGDDTTAQRGDIGKPYKTIGAAIAAARSAATSYQTIILAPGVYDERVTVAAEDGPIDGLVIDGQGNAAWRQNEGPCLEITCADRFANANLNGWTIRGIQFYTDDLEPAVTVTGATAIEFGDTSLFGPMPLTLDSCYMAAGFVLRYLGKAVIHGCQVGPDSAPCEVDTCLSAKIQNSNIECASLLLQFDGTVHQGTGRVSYELSGSKIQSHTMQGQPLVFEGNDVFVRGITQTSGIVPAYVPANNIDLCADITLDGQHADLVTIDMGTESANPSATARPAISGAGSFTEGFELTKGVSAYRIPASFRGSKLGVFDVSFAIDVDAMGASYVQSQLSASNGATIARDTHVFTSVALNGGANAIAIDPPFPASDYAATVEPTDGAALSISGKTGSEVEISATLVGPPVNVGVVLNYRR